MNGVNDADLTDVFSFYGFIVLFTVYRQLCCHIGLIKDKNSHFWAYTRKQKLFSMSQGSTLFSHLTQVSLVTQMTHMSHSRITTELSV